MRRRPGIEVSRDGLWAMLTDGRSILFRARAEWDEQRQTSVFRFRDEHGRRLLPRDPAIKDARGMANSHKRHEELTDEDI